MSEDSETWGLVAPTGRAQISKGGGGSRRGRSVHRRRPRWSELRPLLRFEPLEVSGPRRRLRRAVSIDDLRDAARRRVPRAVFDFVDGDADDGLASRRARDSFAKIEFRPHVLGGTEVVDPSTMIFGRRAALPLVLAPTGFCRLSHHEGERAVARAAARARVPFALTTMGTVSIEDVAGAGGPAADRWFQLYVMRDRGLTADLIRRAKDYGYSTLAVTVDTPVTGQRRKDAYNGFTVPPKLTAGTLIDISRHPLWWLNLLTTEPLAFATVSPDNPESLSTLIDSVFDPTVSFEDIAKIREEWVGPLVLKGILSVEDARKALDYGADGVVLSSHGGRQLNHAPAPLEILPDVVSELGSSLEIFLDSGIRSGDDVAAAVALGAKACLIGRPYLYGLMAGGEAGVDKAIDIFRSELCRSMHLLGVENLEALDPSMVRIRSVI